jgi:diguanylate cyclase (GGDEF)-like protein
MGCPGTQPGRGEMPTPCLTIMEARHGLFGTPGNGMTTTSGALPFSRESLFRQVGPLIGGTLMALLVLALSHTSSNEDTMLILRAATLTAATVTATALLPWNRLPAALQAAPPILYMLVAFLLGQATGGSQSVYEQLILLPVLWLAVYGTSLEVALGLVAVATVLLAPVAVPGAAAQDWSRPGVLILVAAVLGFAVHRVLRQVRMQAARLGVMALTDELTGALNRRAWNEHLSVHLRADETGPATPLVCVAVLDVDHFKELNDRLGHQGGDRFLKELTACWRAKLRDSDVLARLGGDEFAVLLPTCERRVAAVIVERLCSDLPDGQTCSAGLVAWDGVENADELVARADAALYQAKNAGRNRIVSAR